MKGALWLVCAVVGAWLLIGAPVGLMFHVGVMEALVLVLAGFGLVLVAGLLLLDDVMGPRR